MAPPLTWVDVAAILRLDKCENDNDERTRKRRVTRIMCAAGGIDLGQSNWRIEESVLQQWFESGSGKALPSRDGTVYIIGGDFDSVKVGHSNDRTADRRLRGLQLSNHMDLKILSSCPGGYGHESFLHACLARDMTHGEWFKRTSLTEVAVSWMNEKRNLAGLFGAIQSHLEMAT